MIYIYTYTHVYIERKSHVDSLVWIKTILDNYDRIDYMLIKKHTYLI